jgi:hypothetical protein
MPSYDEDDARDIRVKETGILSAAVGRESPVGPLGFGWGRTYARTAGGIQWLYAALFGWMAFVNFMSGRFYNPEFYGKGSYSPAYLDFRWLFLTTVLGPLSVSAFISGCGLVGLRPWVRRWVAAYLGILLLVTAAEIVVDMHRGRLVPESLTASLLFSTASAVPSLPFLFGAVVDRMAEVARRRAREEEPVDESVGVWDRSLDG